MSKLTAISVPEENPAPVPKPFPYWVVVVVVIPSNLAPVASNPVPLAPNLVQTEIFHIYRFLIFK